jgi:phosphopantothenoylcysteine decarboxylase/phosphopantothenate--cysteine ligase
MNYLKDKKILLIITGGIAAYKSLELIRLLKNNGSEIKTVLTKSGKEFVTPLSITSLTQNKVYEELFDSNSEAEMDHITLSRWCDVILVAPATANSISKFSYGNAEDLASTLVLASDKKVILVPAMNVRMWMHQATQENVSKLLNYGYLCVGPEIGEMACGEYGEGKMSEPTKIIEFLNNFFSGQKTISKKKLKAIVTSGPTKEYIDPIRYISNNSSGKQGYEIAKSLIKNGIETTLISGPTNLPDPKNLKLIKVQTGEEMYEETKKNLPVDIAVCAAAVGDFKISRFQKTKIKKQDKINLELEKNRDILNFLSTHNSLRPNLVIGFAAETNNIIENAEAKISKKHCDWIIANDVSKSEIGFDSDFNEVSIIYKDKNKKNELISKRNKSEIAEEITKRILANFNT